MTRTASFLTGLMTLGVVSAIACTTWPPSVALPDRALTPGVVASADAAIICAPGYDRQTRPSAAEQAHNKALILERYGIARQHGNQYEDDHLIPICLGGDPHALENQWAQPWPAAHKKDEVEAAACRHVCATLRASGPDAANLLLHQLQAAFAHDWMRVP